MPFCYRIPFFKKITFLNFRKNKIFEEITQNISEIYNVLMISLHMEKEKIQSPHGWNIYRFKVIIIKK
jgi:hypothetical protein